MATAATRGWGDPTLSTYRKKIVPIKVDNAQFNVHKDVAPILTDFLTRLCFENNYSLDEARDDWSYVLRPIRGYEDEWEATRNFKYLSNHSWGLAIDVNALKNPMTSTLKTDLPVAWVRANIGKYDLAWGGNYSGRKDAMHFEYMGTPRQARALVDSLAAKPLFGEDDMSARIISEDGQKQVAFDGVRSWHIPNPETLKAVAAMGIYGPNDPKTGLPKVWPVPVGTLASLEAAERSSV